MQFNFNFSGILLAIFAITSLSVVYISTRWIFRAFTSLKKLRKSGIKILEPGLHTLLSLFKGDTNEFFTSLMHDIKDSNGLLGWLTPVGKPFLVVFDDKIINQIIVTNQGKLTKHHAFGILEHFRKTDLQSGPAWKVVHRIASKFPVNDKDLQIHLRDILQRYIDNLSSLSTTYSSSSDFAEYTQDYYWDLVLFLVCGDKENPLLSDLYRRAWKACIRALGCPLAHMFKEFQHIPLPIMREYLSLVRQLRAEIMKAIDKKNYPHWTVLAVIQNEMSREDQLEVAMEFLFTGASSVTTSLIWLVWHVAQDSNLQKAIEVEAAVAVGRKTDELVKTCNNTNGFVKTRNNNIANANADDAADLDATVSTISTEVDDDCVAFVGDGNNPEHLNANSSNNNCNDNNNNGTAESENNLEKCSEWLWGSQSNQCQVLEAALKETLRLYSPIHIGRLSVEDMTITAADGKDILIPRGTDIFCNMWFIHRNEDHFSSPDVFDHSRFIGKPLNSPHYHPFSMGVRGCPGQRIAYNIIKIIVANIFLTYNVQTTSESSANLDLKPRFENNLMLPVTPCNVHLKFVKRSAEEMH